MNRFNTLTSQLLTYAAIVTTGLSSTSHADEVFDFNTALERGDLRFNNVMKSKKSWAQTKQEEIELEQKNLTLTEIALDGFFVDGIGEYADRFIAEDYIQHNPIGLNGRDFVKSIFLDSRGDDFKAELDFMISDGDYVLGHSRFTGFGPIPFIAVDVYKVIDGQLVEHWDVIQEEVEASATVSGNAMFPIVKSDEFVPEHQEKRNALMVENAVNALMDGDASVLDSYFSEDYINHNPQASNGLDSLREFATSPRPEGFEFDIGFVIADGPYVAIQTRGAGIGPTPYITFDIFRIENNLIVEHWDVIQEEVTAEDSANGNAMFPIE